MSASKDKRDAYLRRTYGLTSAQYRKMLKRQNNVCAICLRPPKPGKNLHVDHDHKTGRVRGLLDFYCNKRRVGRLREPDYPLVLRVAEYIKSDFDGRSL